MTGRRAWRVWRRSPGSASPRWRCPSATVGSAPASPMSWSPARNSGITRCPARWPSRSPPFPCCSPRWKSGAGGGGDCRRAGTALAGAPRSGDWLAGLAAGELIATLALPPWLPWAVDTGAAGLVLLAAGDDGAAAPRRGARHRSVDPARSLSRGTGGQVLARGAAVAGAAAAALDAGALACAAQLLGAGRALLEASVRHAGQRAQFGRPIGAFQAVKHQLADVAIGLEFAGPLLDAAAGRARRRQPATRPGTCRRRRWPAPTRPTVPPGPRSRCTARSATPRSTTCTCGC